MKINIHALFILLMSVLLMSCSTAKHVSDAKSQPETVLITYHVKPGRESDLEAVLQRAWKIYRHEHLVFEHPHVIVRDTDGPDKSRVIEIFTWVSHSAPEHAPDAVKDVWKQMHDLCEARDGHGGLEGGEVEMWEPAAH